MAVNKGKFDISLNNSTWITGFDAKSIDFTYESLASEDSGRTDDGVMHLTWVKHKIRKFNITMPPMTFAEMSSTSTNPLLTVLGKEYYIRIYDAASTSASAEIFHVYTSNSSASCYNGVILNGVYQGVSFNAIEIAGD